MNAVPDSRPVHWRSLSAVDLVRALRAAGKDPGRASRLIHRATREHGFQILIRDEEVLFLGDFALVAVWERFCPTYRICDAMEYRRHCAEYEACVMDAEREARAEYLELHRGSF